MASTAQVLGDASKAREAGNKALASGDAEKAITHYLEAVHINDSCHLSWSNLSMAHLKIGNAEEATKCAFNCIKHAPHDFVKGWVRLARASHKFGDEDLTSTALHEAAARCLTKDDRKQLKSIAKSLGHVDPFESLSASQQETQEALEQFKRASGAKNVAEEQLRDAKSSISQHEISSLKGKKEEFEKATASLMAQVSSQHPEPNDSFHTKPHEMNTTAPSAPAPSRSSTALPPLSTFQVMLDVCKSSEDEKVLIVRFEVAGSLEAEGPNPAPDRQMDFIGLYLQNECDIEESYNIEVPTTPWEREGLIHMRRPAQTGRYEFRYIADQGRRCAGRSQIIEISGTELGIHIINKEPTPPFMLLKEPNLLCYWLYMPLHQLVEGRKVDLSGTHLPAKLMTSSPDPRIPTMTIDEKIKVRILAPRRGACIDKTGREALHLVPYIELAVDEQVDLDRSTLSFHNGDFLAARLAFSNMFSAANARLQRQLLHPAPVEQEEGPYRNGIQCRKCAASLTKPFHSVNQAPLMPWTEMLEHLTCVPPEVYEKSKGTSDAATRAFRSEAIVARPGVLVLDDAHVDVCREDANLETIQLCIELANVKQAVDDATRSQEHLIRRAIECKSCGSWIGEAVVPDRQNKNISAAGTADGGLDELQEIRLFKYRVQTSATPVFNTYDDAAGSILGARLARLSETHEVRTVLIECVSDGRSLRVQLWTTDSWIRTPATGPEMVPVLKVTYRDQQTQDGVDAHFGVIQVTKDMFDALAKALETSNAWLPPSARVIREDINERFAFLLW